MTDPDLALRRAGGAALRFNAPLSEARAARLAGWMADGHPDLVVDLGCGRGELLQMVLTGAPASRGIGIDREPTMEPGPAREVLTGDLRAWSGPADAVLCVGASHALGGWAGALEHVARWGSVQRAVMADGVWAGEPDDWCREVFGDLPHGLDEVRALAHGAGGDVVELALSDQEEWDRFEGGWGQGVASVGTPEALALAAQREAEYRAHYRGVLGFAWACVVPRPLSGAAG